MTAPESSGPDPAYTTAELARAAGLPLPVARRLVRALGFAEPAEGEVRWTDDDLAVVRGLREAGAASGYDNGTMVRLARAIGQNVARLSDWQVAALSAQPGRLPVELPQQVDEALQSALLHSWRRHVVVSLTRVHLAREGTEQVASAPVTVGFADLVQFSALSNELDDHRLGELVEIFEARSGDVVAAFDGKMVKTLGDSVLFTADQPDQAIEIALGLIDVIGHDGRLPDVRVGLATGPVVTRMGDVFGPPVNLAARLTGLARRNRMIVDQQTAGLLSIREYETRTLTARPLHGFGLVEPVAVRRR